MTKFALGQLGDIEIKQLKIFKAVVECGGFSAAETELNISRPTISNHIAALEDRLNIKLCKRGRAGFSLTPEGKVVYDQTSQLLNRLEQFRSTINNLGESPAGKLRIALSDTFSTDARFRLPEIFRHFYQQAPDVELQVEVDHMKVMEKMVLNNQLDLAMIPYHRKFEGLNYIHLFTDENYVYCGKEHPLFNLPPGQITEKVINSYKLVHAGLKPHEEIYHQLAQMNLSASSYHYESRIAMLLSGCYISFLPAEVARPYVEQGLLKPVAQPIKHFRLGVAVISRKSAQPNRARDMFLHSIRMIHKDAENAPPY
ncbi:LysR family transcriptional regulator [Amphritea pacifica]|uniref:LysR family transcriptional regulator n=1 Tax=Amphritea pacifica TaxID=2811233 RepID=A0ABS2W6B9_9GAMM|nr:LysR family transcriptional regulator [Amphritea pacifica]MBN0987258.1 LysR family transcriptional regulator [Amphritea pacifica]MBN1005748.1 LysR family transcriptional regulator [Amphritea pacifica]